MAWIIVRDAPKHRVELDLLSFPVGAGFRGFEGVLQGIHRVRIVTGDGLVASCELMLPNMRSVHVLRFEQGELHADTSPEARQLAHQAEAGELDAGLISPLSLNHDLTVAWHTATSAIDKPLDEIPLPAKTRGIGNRFARFWKSHGGKSERALRELQSAFARSVLRRDHLAQKRLVETVTAHYTAGAKRIAATPEYFVSFGQSVTAFYKLMPASDPATAMFHGIEHLAADLDRVGTAELTQVAADLKRVHPRRHAPRTVLAKQGEGFGALLRGYVKTVFRPQ